MKQTIEIEVPDGKKAIWKNNKVIFEDIKPQLPKTWEEFCKQNKTNENEEYYLNSISRIVKAEINERHKYNDRNVLPNKQAAEQHLALMQLHQLRDCYRQGWIPDWSDCKNKYGIIYNGAYCIIVNTHTSEFLTFQSREIAQEFFNSFKDLIEQAGDLI